MRDNQAAQILAEFHNLTPEQLRELHKHRLEDLGRSFPWEDFVNTNTDGK